MSNYFDNTNTQVTRGSFGSNYGKKITDKNLIPVTERKKENKQEALMEASKKHMEISKQAQKKQIDKIKNQREFRKVLNESYDKLKDDLFCNMLHHICLEALCIDEQPMYENMENITNKINEQYKELGGFKAIKEQAKKTNNVLLERMISLCENTAKKVADRNMKESDSADGFKFELTDDEKDDFEYNKDNINIDAISNKIKDKVIKVVSDEKEANNKKTEIMDEIEDKLKEDDVEDEATEEAMQFVFNENIETTTLFEALMRECYKITLETPKDLIFESYVKEECEDDIDDPEYNLNELDSYDDNNLMNDEVAEDLMISESFVKQLPVEKLKELEGYLSEAVRIKAKPGNLGFHFSYDTGVSDIIQSAKKREHIAKVVTQPGFRTSIMSLLKSAKHGPDIAYINQLAKLPHRLFGKKGRNVKILEDYTEWLNGEYKEAYLEALDNLGISLNTIPEFKQHLMPYEPMEDVFIEHAKSILEAVKDGDYEQLDKNLKDTSKDMKKVAEDCGKSKKNLSACKESIREVQKSTEELKDESKNNKLAKEACSPTTIAEDDKDLSEMLVCPICEKDPCECESDEVLNEEMLEDNLFEDAEFDDDDSEDEDIKKYLKEEDDDEDDDEEDDDDEEEDDDEDIVEEGLVTKIKSDCSKLIDKRIKELSVKKESFNIFVDDIDESDDFLEESSSFICRSCGYVAEGKAPEYCPECGNDGDQFQVMEGYVKNLKAARKARKNISKDAYKFSIRNSGNILLNILQRNRNLESCRKRLEKMARKCKTLEEIEYLQKDIPNGKKYIQNKMNSTDDPKKKEEYKKHLKWMSSDYSKIISNRKKELKNALKEQADFEQDFLYGKDRAVYENKDYSPSLNVPKPSKMRQYCLLKKINEATSFADIDKIKDYINEEVKEYKYNKEYTNWLKESAMNAVVLKHTVLEENIVIESFLDSLDDICDSIDKRLDSHDEAKQIALESMYTNFNGHNVFAPIFKANDVNSSNIEFAYKVKFLCEGLKGLTKDCENNIDLSQAERLIKRNADIIDTVMESLDSSSYKYGILYNAKTYLEKISNKIPEIKDAYLIESVDVDYDEDILTEAIEMTDELYDNAISDDIMYNTKNSQMDVVMAEAITKYTIMETFNTLRLTDLNNTDIEKIVRSIVK